jgi:transposase
VARDWRDERITELEQQLAERDRRIAQLEQQLSDRDRQFAAALERIAALEERLRQSSKNSSKPPSADSPAQAGERRKQAAQITKPAGQRKPGGQPGHRKFARQLLPPEQVDRHHDCIPEQCEQCSASLSGHDPSPELHQVWHLPAIKPSVDQYALHALGCGRCQHVTRGKLPAGVPTGAFGPSVVAVVALLIGACRLGKRTVQALMADLFRVQMSLGAVINCQQRASSALAVPVEQAREFVQRAEVKHADETSWREGQKRFGAWLWTAVTHKVTVFAIYKDRSAEVARELLGKVRGVLVSDRYSAYGFWTLHLRQACWSHLIRDFVAISERSGSSARIGAALLDKAKQLFQWWHRVRDGTLSRETFRKYVGPLKKDVHALLVEGQRCAHKKTARTCTKMLAVFSALWLFVERTDVEPTNNCAERALRHAVLWRKISGGTHSELGSRFVERILTVVATLRQQNRNVLDFLRVSVHG